MSLPLQATRAPRSTVPTHVPIGGQEWPLEIARHPRARRISIRVKPPGLRQALPLIVLTVPKRAAVGDALKFLQANTVWLARELTRHAPAETAQDGSEVSVLGEALTFRHTGQLRGLPRREENTIWLSGTPERFSARIEAYITKEFEQFANEEAAQFARTLNVSLSVVYAKRMRSRWGSCSPTGDIALNWRLALAPREVARYVIAHEVAHRRQMNHSPAFWAEVRIAMPDFPNARDWLKREGHSLYQLQL